MAKPRGRPKKPTRKQIQIRRERCVEKIYLDANHHLTRENPTLESGCSLADGKTKLWYEYGVRQGNLAE